MVPAAVTVKRTLCAAVGVQVARCRAVLSRQTVKLSQPVALKSTDAVRCVPVTVKVLSWPWLMRSTVTSDTVGVPKLESPESEPPQAVSKDATRPSQARWRPRQVRAR